MAGLLDWVQTPEGIGLLSAVAGGMAGARRGQPINSMGRGLVTGLQGYAGAQDQIKQDADNKLAQQYRQMQIDEMQRQMAARTASTEASQAAYKQAYKPAVAAVDPITTYAPQFGGNDSLMGGYTAAMGGDFSPSPMLSQPEARPAPYAQPQPEAINIPGREAQPGGFDQDAYREAMFNQLAQKGMPDEAFKYAPKEKDPIKLGSGDSLIDPKTLKPLYSAPEKQSTPSSIQEYQFARSQGYVGTFDDFKKSNAKAGATNVAIGPTRVENITTQESEGSKVYGRGLGEMQVEIQKQGFTAPTRIANLDRMSQLLEGVDSGRFSGAGLEAARFAKSFGLNVDPKLGNKQAAEALAIEMALQMREPGSGPMTDKDFDNYLNTVPSLAKTAEGRKQITATLKAKARRDIEISKMARAYAKQNRGVVDDNFLDQVAEYMAKNPVVPIAQDYGGGWKMEKVK